MLGLWTSKKKPKGDVGLKDLDYGGVTNRKP